jgi:hypothetical protein
MKKEENGIIPIGFAKNGWCDIDSWGRSYSMLFSLPYFGLDPKAPIRSRHCAAEYICGRQEGEKYRDVSGRNGTKARYLLLYQ